MILLDTHIWVWMNLEPKNIPKQIAQQLQAENVELGISAISIWEALLLAEKGRIETVLGPLETIKLWLSDDDVVVHPITGPTSMLARTLRFDHGDPADRFIAATAYQLNCPIATLDKKLQSLEWLKTI